MVSNPLRGGLQPRQGMGLEYPADEVLKLLDSPFVDDALFAARLGGVKQDPEAVRRFMELPLGARPDVAWYFDRAWYLLRYPDIADVGADPFLHFLGWGVGEGRAPHPLIDPRYMREADPDLLADPLTVAALLDVLDNDRIDPSARFVREHYRSQLDNSDIANGGLLRHFLEHGLLAGLRPAPGLDPLGAWRQARVRTHDIRAGLRHLALARPGAQDSSSEPPSEGQAKALFLANARALLPGYGRAPLDFDSRGLTAALSVIMVVHDRFALTMAALASLRANFTGVIELILFDSGSSDETRQIGRYLHGARILRFEENIGFLHGCNAALRFASAEALLYLNNDVELTPGAVDAAMGRLHADPATGAVGAKLIRTHGMLQEAGSIVWRDGQTAGYMRDASPLAPEANFVRDVDYCSAAFLLARTALVRDLGGFDEAFAPGYYEDADLCLRIREAGYRVIYDPAVVVRHLEHGSSDGVGAAAAMMSERRDIFFRKHMTRLRFRYTADARAPLFARTASAGVSQGRRRVLFIDDQVPLRGLGQGFVRSNDIVRALAEGGQHVTVYPVYASRAELTAIYADMPDTVEVMYDRSIPDLESFLKARRGYYDTIWIARTHNLARIKPILERGGMDVVGGVRLVLDTEAIAATREAARRAAIGDNSPFDVDNAIRAEFEDAWFCQAVVAVSEAEATRLSAVGFADVTVLGHARDVTPTARTFAERAGLLFIGAIPEADCPNLDALMWFADEVLPRIEAELGHETRLTVAGFVGEGVNLSRLAAHPRISLRGAVADLAPLYDRHRVFVAPTRYAAGIPYKIHEAAAMGLPVVATELLRAQLGWQDERDLLSASTGDAEAFARAVLTLYRSEQRWTAIREAAAAQVAAECGKAEFESAVAEILTPKG
jgi:O-antigen biosynthesis protein